MSQHRHVPAHAASAITPYRVYNGPAAPPNHPRALRPLSSNLPFRRTLRRNERDGDGDPLAVRRTRPETRRPRIVAAVDRRLVPGVPHLRSCVMNEQWPFSDGGKGFRRANDPARTCWQLRLARCCLGPPIALPFLAVVTGRGATSPSRLQTELIARGVVDSDIAPPS